MELLIALIALSSMEIVLGIDNIVFIAILTGKLPVEQQPKARKLGLTLALVMRILLLMSLTVILKLDDPIFHLTDFGLPESWFEVVDTGSAPMAEDAAHASVSHDDAGHGGGHGGRQEINAVSIKDLILLIGGLFLIWKSVHEIHKKVGGDEEDHAVKEQPTFGNVLFQIAIMDAIFSLDSVITAVGMVKSEGGGIYVMIASVMIAIGVMMAFAESVSNFVAKNPTLKMLALSFLILIGSLLVAEGIGTHFDKGYIYFAMAFALVVEVLNLRMKHKHAKK